MTFATLRKIAQANGYDAGRVGKTPFFTYAIVDSDGPLSGTMAGTVEECYKLFLRFRRECKYFTR